ncbi:MAG: hypothetical protein WA700_02185 [Acidobacteriaceae bacterium]
MTAKEQDAKPVDPFEALRGVRDAYLDSMSKVMINAVNSEEYAEATGTLLNGYLTLTAPAREALDKAMLQALEQFSLPSRQQVAVLAERLTNIETRCDDMDAKLDRILEMSHSNQPTETANPSATRRAATNGTRSTHPRTRKG